ncbi:MAG: hypothetical protein KDA84_17630 [Planctomycetaceae bacterium]|nr:hypothetical protein [Planctomycetaceae bacterium]
MFSAVLLLGTLSGGMCNGEETDSPSKTEEKEAESPNVKKELFTGEVLLLGEALKQKGVTSFEEMHNQAALVTPEKEIIPIVADWRGRAFFQDKRLRNRKVQLVGTRKPGVPYLQVLMVFTFNDNGERMYTDYWCDVCSIPMYEIKPCDCCQGDIRLRFQEKPLPSYLPDLKKKKESVSGKSNP